MTVDQLLDELARRGVELWIDSGLLRFKAPKEALDEALLALLKARKAAVIERLASRGGSQRRHPLTYGQRSLWFLHQVAPTTAAYNVAYPCRIRSAIDLPAFNRALQQLTARHSALRTAFVVSGGEPFQEIAEQVEPTCSLVEVAGCTQAVLAEQVANAYRQPFDLSQPPLLRATLFRRAADDQVLLLVLHHLVCDGWSLMQILVDELGQLYQAALTGVAAALPAVMPQYVDYVHWQRHYLTQPAAAQALAYWRERLAGELPVLDLPTDRPRPAVSALRGASYGFELPPPLASAMRAVAQAHNATLYMYLVAALQLLLARNSAQEEVLIGSPSGDRSRPDFAAMVGHMVNTIVLRAQLGDNPPFAELLQRVRSEVLNALEHQEYPFALLVEQLQPERDLSRSPIFQAMVVTHKGEGRQELFGGTAAAGRWGGMVIEPYTMPQQAGQFDLTLEVAEVGEALACVFKYNAEIFTPEHIANLAEQFQVLVAAVNRAPQTPVALLPLLSAQELQLQLEQWNATAAPWLSDQCLHQLFAAQVQRTPDAPALVTPTERLSYRELEARAEQLAAQLRQLGVGPEQLVGVFLPRQSALIVALLAVLKAGGAYVPIDPRYPPQRIAFMVEDAAARIIITDSSLVGRLPATAATVVQVDGPPPPLPAAAADEVRPPRPADLAYVLFTSGSTGRPKGVQIEHRSAVAMLCWARDSFSAAELSWVLASTSVCFDLSVFEIFVPLSWGGCVVLAESALELPQLALAGQVTLINTVPSAIAELLRIDGIPAGVRTINLAGEPLKGALVQALYRHTGVERVLNLYGPSEDTTYSTWAVIPRDDSAAPTIGRPIANTRAYVLSPQLQPVPIGTPGELYLAGAGLSRGYWQRPDLSAERFLPDPFVTDPAARMYRTGDFVRYLANGELLYLGRADNQVKLRGFRIELGEVEEVLSRFPAVQEVAALVHSDHQGAKLVAYLAAKPGSDAPVLAELREFARAQLPYFMVPTDLILLPQMPHTPNGKIDRAALPAPAVATAPLAVAAGSAPSGALERVVAGIWEEVLERSPIASDDNFFEIGGHSLLAAKVSHRLNQILGTQLGAGLLFEYPTIAALARAIDAIQSGTVPHGAGAAALDLWAEAELDPALVPPSGGQPASLDGARSVLLSGATGFIGGYLLWELLRHSSAVIHCLVRAADEAQALERIALSLQRHGVELTAAQQARIRPLLGDLVAPHFGLSEAVYGALAEEVDLLFHSAAALNLAYPYPLLKPTNVDGTTEFIRFACTGRIKPLHYLSTISVFDGSGYFDGRVIRETDEPDEITGLDHGYAQSKWVAERRVKAAAQRGLPVTIHRLGSVIGASDTGIWHADDIMHQMLAAAVELEQWIDIDLATYLAPVDYVARSIVELARHPSAFGQTFHLIASNVVRSGEVRDWLHGCGIDLAPVSSAEWQGSFARRLAEGGAPPPRWSGLLPLLEHLFSEEQLAKLLDRHARSPRFDCSGAERALRAAAIATPAVDGALMRRFLATRGNFTAPADLAAVE